MEQTNDTGFDAFLFLRYTHEGDRLDSRSLHTKNKLREFVEMGRANDPEAVELLEELMVTTSHLERVCDTMERMLERNPR